MTTNISINTVLLFKLNASLDLYNYTVFVLG